MRRVPSDSHATDRADAASKGSRRAASSGGRRRGRRAGVVAGALVATGAFVLAALLAPSVVGKANTTSITATKTAAAHLVTNYPWTLSKTVSKSSLTLSNSESETVTYTVGATKGAGVLSAYFDGQVCVTNTGSVPTTGLAISDTVSIPPSKATVAGPVAVDVSARPNLAPGETHCYPYRVDLFGANVIPGDTYKDTASVTITNKSGGGSGPSPSATTILPSIAGSAANDSITVVDTNGGSWTFSATGTKTYDKTFTCDADAGSHGNTVQTSGFVANGAVSTPAPASATVDVTCLDPDVSVTKTVDHAAATADDTLTYTVTVGNAGPGKAYGVALSDTLPALDNLAIDNATDFALSGGSLTLAGQPITLASGASKTVHVSGTVTDALCDTTATNTASVSATNEPAANVGNDSASASTTVGCVNLAITKTADYATVSAGDTVGYVITVSNSGAGTAKGVTLIDSLPGGLAWTIDAGNTTATGCAISNSTLTCGPDDIAGGGSVTLHMTASSTAQNCGTLTNTATATPTNGSGATSSAATITVLCPNLSVTKTADAATVNAGDPVGFTIVVQDSGLGTAKGVVLTDSLPGGLAWTVDAGGTTATGCSISGSLLTCGPQDLASGAIATVHVVATSTQQDCGTLSNDASAVPTNGGGATSEFATVTVQCADATVTKTGNGPISAGDVATFTITVSVTGSGSLSNVTLADTLPGGLTWALTPAVSGCSISGSPQSLSCSWATLAAGTAVPIVVSATTTAQSCGVLSNSATVAAANESDPTNDASQTATIEVDCASIQIEKTTSTPAVSAGDPISYTITASNAGLGTARNVTVTDILPATPGLAWSISPAVAACSISGGTLTCSFGDIASGGSKSVTLTSPTTTASCGSISNTASVTTTNDGSATTPAATVTVSCPNPDLSVTKTADAATVSAGDPVGFSISVTNNGLGAAQNVTLSDTLPATPGVTWSIASQPAGNPCTLTGASLSCAFGPLAPGATAGPVHITGTSTAASCGTWNNTATAQADNNTAVTGSASILVDCPNQPPVNTVPGAQTVNEDTPLTFSSGNSNAISIADPDAGTDPIQTTLTVAHGTLTLGGTAGLTVTGNGTATVVATGSQSDINAALNGLVYQGDQDWNSTRGTETFTITTNDLGHNGSGGAKSDTDTVGITVNAVNDPPVAAAKSFTVQANMKITGLGGLLTGATDPDTGDVGYTASFSVHDIVLGTCTNGTISNVNTTAGTFDFDPPPGLSGSCTLQYRIDDSGNPAPPATSAYANIVITINGPVIWFVDPASGTNGDGRLSNPFNNLASADAVDASGQRIFVYTGSTTTGIILNTDEWLVGQGVTGASFDSVFGISPPAGTIARPSIGGTRPSIGGTVAMKSSAAVRGLNVTPASGNQGVTSGGGSSLVVGEVSVTTANAIAVNLTGGASGTFSFTSVSSNGGTSGIVLNNVNTASGSFAVTGTGTTGSGGTIQNATDSGVLLTTTANVSLSYMTIQNNGNALNEGGIRATGLTGTNSVTSSTVSGGYEDNVYVQDTAGTLTGLTIQGPNCFIGNNNLSAGNTGVTALSAGTANMTVTVNGCAFSGNRTDTIHVDAGDTATMNATITNNVITAGTGGNNQGNLGIDVSSAVASAMTYNVAGNKVGTPDDGTTKQPLINSGIVIFRGATSGTMSGKVTGNTVIQDLASSNPGSGIVLSHAPTSTTSTSAFYAKVDGNQVGGSASNYGILVESAGITAATGNTQVQLTNNIVATGTATVPAQGATALDAIRVSGRRATTSCYRISGNTASTAGSGFYAFYLRKDSTASESIEGLAAGSQTDTTTKAYIASVDTIGGPGVGADPGSTFTGVAANSCSSIPN